MANIVEDMDLSDILNGNSSQTYQHYSQMVKLFLQRPNILRNTEYIEKEEDGPKTIDISRQDDGTLFSSKIKEGPLQVRAARQYIQIPVKHS